jgi:hypothetical protein
MGLGLEIVVRPSQTPDVRPFPSAGGPPVPQADEQFIEIGGGEVSVTRLSYSFSSSTSRSRKTREIDREVDVLRIKNPDDEEQFVDVEVARKVNMVDQQTGEKVLLDMPEGPIPDNVEVLSRGERREPTQQMGSYTPLNRGE